MSLRASRKGEVAISIYIEEKIKARLASPTHSPTQLVGERDCFVASLLAMTIKLAVIASLLRSRRRGNLYFGGFKKKEISSIACNGKEVVSFRSS